MPEQEQAYQRYLMALKNEYEFYSRQYDLNQLATLYLGGGNPGLRPDFIQYIFNNLISSNSLSSIKEITIESNPSNITEKILQICQAFARPIRFSLGIQSFHQPSIGLAQRNQSQAHVQQALSLLCKYNFNTSIDLINGLPGQNIDHEIKQLEIVLDRYPMLKHISFYDLSLDQNSYFHKNQNQYRFPDQDQIAEYEKKMHCLVKQYQFKRYEISNYCRENSYSQHNLAYWQYKNYLGLGPAAHSTINQLRIENHAQLDQYVEQKNYRTKYNLELKQQIEEYLLMGFRLLKGINKNSFDRRFQSCFDSYFSEICHQLSQKKLLISTNKTVRLTKKGIDWLNPILVELFSHLDGYTWNK